MFEFPVLDRPTIFLASPGDVARLRDRATAALATLHGRLAEDLDLKLYDWDEEVGEGGFDSGRPAQAQLARPDDPFVQATICILGERLGTPMPANTPLGVIASLGAMDPNLEHRLVHPWMKDAAKSGGFALTGTVFECLSAIAGGGSLYLAVIGDETVRDPTVPIENAFFGGQAHYEFKRESFGRDRRAMRIWEEDVYLDQVMQLRNFLLYLVHLGHQVNYLGADEDRFKSSLLAWLNRRFSPAAAHVDPFKGLQVYDVEDHEVYFGRNAERQRAIGQIEELWDERSLPTAFCITGGSGAGKSSFLRAGVIGRMCAGSRHLRPLVLRPAELLQSSAADGEREAVEESLLLARQGLETLVERILATLHPRQSEADTRDLIERARNKLARRTLEALPAAAARMVHEAIEACGERTRLLLAIDQFEELVDQVRQPSGATAWRPVIELLRGLIRTRRVALIYTLQANRVGFVADDPLIAPLWAESWQMPLDFPLQGLRDIIAQPFRATGKVELSTSLEQALHASVLEFKNSEDRSQHQGSLLPLVSLTLKRIYDNCAQPSLTKTDTSTDAEDHAPASVSHAFGEAAGALPASDEGPFRLELAVCADRLAIGEAISDLADAAVAETRNALGPNWSDNVVGDLLRRLVAVADDDHRKFSLPDAELPTSPAQRTLVRALADRRLILREPNDKIRLVHEAVLEYWPVASEWVEHERPVLHDVRIAQAMAEEWARSHDPRAFLLRSGHNEIERAGGVLTSWADILTDEATLERSDRKRTLRDYALELIGAHPAPGDRCTRSDRGITRLMQVAYYRRNDLVEKFLALDPDSVHLTRTDGRTVVFYPAFSGDLAMLDALIGCGAATDRPDVDGWRPVHAAATSGHPEIVERLVARGAGLTGDGAPDGITPLMLASRLEAPATVQMLLALGAHPNHAREGGWRALHEAAGNNADAACRHLLDAGADPDAGYGGGWTALHIAAQNGYRNIAQTLLDAGAKADPITGAPEEGKFTSPLHLAIAAGHDDIAILLIGCGADVLARERGAASALQVAVGRDDLSLLAAICARREDLDAAIEGEKTALDLALDRHNAEASRMLIAAGASLMSPFRLAGAPSTRLHRAIHDESLERTALLLSLGADPNGVDARGRSPLHMAAAMGSAALARTLLTSGSDPALGDAMGMTPFDLATLRGDLELMAILTPAQEDLRAAEAANASPVHLASASGTADAVRYLLDLGLTPQSRDRDGRTPLLIAAEFGHSDVVQHLLSSGAAPNLRGLDPAVTPLEVAVQLGHASVVELLLPYAGDHDAGETLIGLAVEGGHDAVIALLLSDRGAADEATAPPFPVDRYLHVVERWAGGPAAKAERLTRLRGLLADRELDEAIRRYENEAQRSILGSTDTATAPPPSKSAWVEEVARNPAAYAAHSSTLGFYARHRLVRTPVHAMGEHPQIGHCLLADDGSVLHLDGTSLPIHEANARERLALTSEHALDYMAFFGVYVQAQGVPFVLVSAGRDDLIPSEVMNFTPFAERIRPPRLTLLASDDYEIDALVLHGNALYQANFELCPSGAVKMTSDELLLSDLPAAVSYPLG